jgi:hypothetical protein
LIPDDSVNTMEARGFDGIRDGIAQVLTVSAHEGIEPGRKRGTEVALTDAFVRNIVPTGKPSGD